MKLYVPEIGTKLVLRKPWKFVLHNEYRNTKLIEAFGINKQTSNDKYLVTLPVDTVLTVKRIYIRQGVSTYSSLTFSITKGNCPNNSKLEKTKFWASLNDVYNIDFEFYECDVETKKTILSLYDELKEKYSTHEMKKMTKIIFEKEAVLSLSPQIDPHTWFVNMFNRIKGTFIENDSTLYSILNNHYRKYKIQDLVEVL